MNFQRLRGQFMRTFVLHPMVQFVILIVYCQEHGLDVEDFS
jgi:hypothetical protein